VGVRSAYSRLLDIVVVDDDWPSSANCTQHAGTKRRHISSADKRAFNSPIKACRLDQRELTADTPGQ